MKLKIQSSKLPTGARARAGPAAELVFAKKAGTPANPTAHRAIGVWSLAFLWCLVLGIWGFFPASAAEPLKIRFHTDWYPQPEHGGFYHAWLKGYYKDAGLDVEITPGGPQAFAVPRVGAGLADIGMGSCDDVLIANDRGIPAVAIGATMQNDPQGLLLHVDDPVKSFADLEGRSIAVTPGTAWFPYLVKKYGLKKVREIPHTFSIGPFLKDPNYIQMCFLTSEPFYAKLAGVDTRVLLIKDTGYAPYRVIFTRRDFLEKHHDAVKAFVEASYRGWREYLADPSFVHADLKKRNPELTPAKMDYSAKALLDYKFVLGDPEKGESQGLMLAKRWQFQFDTLKDLGVIKGKFNVADAWTGEFIPKP
jgi:NitT/TauT family transport system substrate-binding protein